MPGTVIRVQVEHLPGPRGRAVKTLWLWWAGPGTPDLDLCWRSYIRRFDLEHTFRFCKQTLGWTTPRVRTPEQADRWTWLILAAPTPSCGWPACSPPTRPCPGNAGCRPPG